MAATRVTTQDIKDAAITDTDVAAANKDGAKATPSMRTLSASSPASIGTATAGSAVTASSSDHVHATGAGTPSTQAFGDAASVGTGPAAAMSDHKHGMPAMPGDVAVTQVSHGLAVGNAVRLSSTTYVKAKADTAANAEVVGIVSAVADADHFTLTTEGGRVTGLSSLTAATVYFLDPSTAGATTATEPTTAGQISKPLLIADTTTSAFVVGMRGQVVGGGATSELSYVEFTAAVTVTATTEATANTAVTAGAVSLDGSTKIKIEFFCYCAAPPIASSAVMQFWLYDGSTSLGTIGQINSPAAGSTPDFLPVHLDRRFTPSAASHTYSIRASVNAGTGTLYAAAGGVTLAVPGFIAISRA